MKNKNKKNLLNWLLCLLTIVLLLLAVEISARCFFYQKHAPDRLGILYLTKQLRELLSRQPALTGSQSGINLNRTAWEATFSERGLPGRLLGITDQAQKAVPIPPVLRAGAVDSRPC